VSYWDPAHHGAAVAGIETLLLCAGAGVLWRRSSSLWVRIPVAALVVLSLLGWTLFYAAGWLPPAPQ
jgi:hypothetical protein